jgi:hypothetical protein
MVPNALIDVGGCMTVGDRYRARSGEHGWGVWDHAMNGWHGRQDLSEDEAKQVADEINCKIQRRDTQVAPGSRQVNPPKRAFVRFRDEWREVTLDWWVRESDGWHGRVKDSISGLTRWVHADNIRQAK